MYLTFDQVVLVQDKKKARPDDPVMYERELRGQRILTPDGGPSKYASEAKRYGVYYIDKTHDENICVVPDTWDENDALLAKTWIE